MGMCLCVVICVIVGQGWMTWFTCQSNGRGCGHVPVCGDLCGRGVRAG